MRHRLFGILFLLGGTVVTVVLAGIPEPDLILFGQVFIDGRLQQSQDNVSVIGRVDAVPDPVASYRLGDNPGAGDAYILRVRLESLADGSSQSRNAALVGQTLHVYVQKGTAPQQLFADYAIPSPGHVQHLDLGEHLHGDWNADRKIALDDFAHLGGCMEGPAGNPSEQCLAVFDFDGNREVDLADWRSFQTAFTGR